MFPPDDASERPLDPKDRLRNAQDEFKKFMQSYKPTLEERRAIANVSQRFLLGGAMSGIFAVVALRRLVLPRLSERARAPVAVLAAVNTTALGSVIGGVSGMRDYVNMHDSPMANRYRTLLQLQREAGSSFWPSILLGKDYKHQRAAAADGNEFASDDVDDNQRHAKFESDGQLQIDSDREHENMRAGADTQPAGVGVRQTSWDRLRHQKNIGNQEQDEGTHHFDFRGAHTTRADSWDALRDGSSSSNNNK